MKQYVLFFQEQVTDTSEPKVVVHFILDGVDNKNETAFALTLEDEPTIETKEESLSFIPHPPCSDEYIFIKV